MSNDSNNGGSGKIVRIVLYIILALVFVGGAIWALNNVGDAGGMGDGSH